MPRHLAPFSLPIILALSACASLTPSHRYVGSVVAVPATEVSPCQFVGEISNTSGLTGFFGPKGIDNIKQALLRQADAMGATHVVWEDPQVGYDSSSLKARAYRCKPSEGAK